MLQLKEESDLPDLAILTLQKKSISFCNASDKL